MKHYGTPYFILFALMLGMLGQVNGQKTIYVDYDGSGGGNDGSSWATAFYVLEDALAIADTGDQIWVAQGYYSSFENDDSTFSFLLDKSISLYGGFAGFENSLSQRDTSLILTQRQTYLEDNSRGEVYHIIETRGKNTSIVLDGFIIRNARAEGTHEKDKIGAGIYNAAGKLELRNMLFENNRADSLASAIYSIGDSVFMTHCQIIDNYDRAMVVEEGEFVHIQNCKFIDNALQGACKIDVSFLIEDSFFGDNSAESGAALTFSVISFNDKAVIRNTVFENNRATRGGGAINASWGKLVVDNCTFLENEASRGGAINFDTYLILDSLIVLNSEFINNSAEEFSNSSSSIGAQPGDGGAIAIDGSGDISGGRSSEGALLSGCTFEKNNAENNGGAVFALDMDIEIQNSVFSENKGNSGGAVWGKGGPYGLEVQNSSFSHNESSLEGGGICWLDEEGSSTVRINEADFEENNSRGSSGGGIFLESGVHTLSHVDFRNNKSSNSGAGAYILQGRGIIDSSLFQGNICDCSSFLSTEQGGASLFFGSGNFQITHSRFSENLAREGTGGAIYLNDQGDLFLRGARFEKNYVRGNGGAIFSRGSLILESSRFYGNVAFDGSGGAICSSGESATLAIDSSAFIRNRTVDVEEEPFSEGLGGAIFHVGRSGSISQSSFLNNEAFRHGGGIFAGPSFSFPQRLDSFKVKNSYFAYNLAFLGGGGLFIEGFQFLLQNSPIFNNAARNFSDTLAITRGGGIVINTFFESDEVPVARIINSSLIQNIASKGGGIYAGLIARQLGDDDSALGEEESTVFGDSDSLFVLNEIPETISIANTTFGNNFAFNEGGALWCFGHDVLLSSCTVFDNGAEEKGAGILINGFSEYVLSNSLLGENSLVTGRNVTEVRGIVRSLGHNLLWNLDRYDIPNTNWKESDLLGNSQNPINPGLDSWWQHGGLVAGIDTYSVFLPVFPLQYDSQAKGKGLSLIAAAGMTDQRGFLRSFDQFNDSIDIGAYEAQYIKIIPSEEQICAGADSFQVIGDIRIQDPTGGAIPPFVEFTLNLALPDELSFNPEVGRAVGTDSGLTVSAFRVFPNSLQLSFRQSGFLKGGELAVTGLEVKPKSQITTGEFQLEKSSGLTILPLPPGEEDLAFSSIQVLPTVRSFPFLEDFENGPGIWFSRADSLEGSWNWEKISSSLGGLENNGERIWLSPNATHIQATLESGCLDLSSLEKPMIKFSKRSASFPDFDGSILQYSTDVGKTWNTLGGFSPELESKLNWYNSSSILANPGEQSTTEKVGWSGIDSAWSEASYILDSIQVPDSYLRFRFVYGSTPEPKLSESELFGFGFDNFFLGERNRSAVLEYFTDSIRNNSYEQFLAIAQRNSDELIPLLYLFDQEEGIQTTEYSARSAFYGLSDPSTDYILSGKKIMGSEISQIDVLKENIENALFSIQLEDELSVIANEDFPGSTIIRVIVVENRVLLNADTVDFVVRKFLPDPSGIPIDDWIKGQTEALTMKWNYRETPSTSPIQNPEFLNVVVMIQDKVSKKIYQSAIFDGASSGLIDGLVSLRDSLIDRSLSFQVFPNPASSEIHIMRDGASNVIHQYSLKNLLGKEIQTGILSSEIHSINIDDISPGLYLVEIYSEAKKEVHSFLKK